MIGPEKSIYVQDLQITLKLHKTVLTLKEDPLSDQVFVRTRGRCLIYEGQIVRIGDTQIKIVQLSGQNIRIEIHPEGLERSFSQNQVCMVGRD